MAKQMRKRGGGRLNRSETVTVRLDPKLNYLAEIAARAQRRTKSNLIEAALAQALNSVPIDPRPSEKKASTVAQLAEILWHVDEVKRLQQLMMAAPHLLTFEEQKIWAVICDHSYFWVGKWQPLNEDEEFFFVDHNPARLWTEHVQEHWDNIKRVAEGKVDKSVMPDGPKIRPKKVKPVNALLASKLRAIKSPKEAK